jgi:Uma2 family endonuclease
MLTTRQPLKICTDEFDRMANAGVLDPSRRNIELIGGQLYEMAPIGTAHLIAVTRLSAQLVAFAARQRLLVQQPIRVPDHDEPQPDLVVLKEPLGLRKPQARDRLVAIEVSDTHHMPDADEPGGGALCPRRGTALGRGRPRRRPGAAGGPAARRRRAVT